MTKLAPSGSSLVYSTYLGGSGNDYAQAVAVDSAGNAYVAGYTGSTDFPTLNPYQASFRGSDDNAFVAKLTASSSTTTSTPAGPDVSSIQLGRDEWPLKYGPPVTTLTLPQPDNCDNNDTFLPNDYSFVGVGSCDPGAITGKRESVVSIPVAFPNPGVRMSYAVTQYDNRDDAITAVKDVVQTRISTRLENPAGSCRVPTYASYCNWFAYKVTNRYGAPEATVELYEIALQEDLVIEVGFQVSSTADAAFQSTLMHDIGTFADKVSARAHSIEHPSMPTSPTAVPSTPTTTTITPAATAAPSPKPKTTITPTATAAPSPKPTATPRASVDRFKWSIAAVKVAYASASQYRVERRRSLSQVQNGRQAQFIIFARTSGIRGAVPVAMSFRLTMSGQTVDFKRWTDKLHPFENNQVVFWSQWFTPFRAGKYTFIGTLFVGSKHEQKSVAFTATSR